MRSARSHSGMALPKRRCGCRMENNAMTLEILPRTLPAAPKFQRMSTRKQAKCLIDALGAFLDTLQVEGRDPTRQEIRLFHAALEAIACEDGRQAYLQASILRNNLVAAHADADTDTPQPSAMSRHALELELRNATARRCQ